MKAKEAIAVFRLVAVHHQWSGGTCSACKASAPDHLRACPLADALEQTAGDGFCPRCFGDLDKPHAPQCPKTAKT